MGKLEIGDAISKGWDIYKGNFGLVFLASLIVSLIAGVSCNICLGPLLCGFFMVLARLARNSEPRPAVGDVFKGFNKFLHSFLLLFLSGIGIFIINCILMIIPIIGWVLLFVLAWVYGPLIMWALMLVANRDMKWTEALGLVIKSTFNGSFMMPILLGILAGIIGGVGVVLCGIGILFTIPLSFCIYAAAYEQVFGGEGNGGAPVEPEVVS